MLARRMESIDGGDNVDDWDPLVGIVVQVVGDYIGILLKQAAYKSQEANFDLWNWRTGGKFSVSHFQLRLNTDLIESTHRFRVLRMRGGHHFCFSAMTHYSCVLSPGLPPLSMTYGCTPSQALAQAALHDTQFLISFPVSIRRYCTSTPPYTTRDRLYDLCVVGYGRDNYTTVIQIIPTSSCASD